MPTPPQRAEPARKPVEECVPGSAEAGREVLLRVARQDGEARERRSMTRALVLLALLVLLASVLRAGWGRVFVAGWWRL